MSAPAGIDHEQYREELEALGRDLARLLARRWLDRHAADQAAAPPPPPPAPDGAARKRGARSCTTERR